MLPGKTAFMSPAVVAMLPVFTAGAHAAAKSGRSNAAANLDFI
jgi:hypothetical protein